MMRDTFGIYIHIPFCLKKCDYCDFCSYTGKTADEMLAYTKALCLEMRSFAERMKGRVADTLFVGGGTPTLLPHDAWQMLADCIFECFAVTPDAEWTVEANPATLDAEKAAFLHRLGVNRLSIGMQSAHDSELLRLGRVHRANDLYEAAESARAGGFENINLDLMFGIPEQSEESFAATLDAALALSPTHLSVYSLQVEEGTPFYSKQDTLPLPDEDCEDRMHTVLLAKMKEAGFAHYEISNFALPGYECRHNLRYWKRSDYLGFGISAHACLNGVRSYNTDKLDAYLQDPCGVRECEDILTPEAAEYEAIMLGLRLGEGITEEEFSAAFGHGFYAWYGDALSRFIRANLAVWDGKSTRLTEDGMRLSNTVLTELFTSNAAAHLFP